MATVVETYLDNAIVAKASYGDLSKDLSANKYMNALTDTGFGKPGMTTQQAKAFAGVIEQTNDDGSVVKDGDGNIQYKFVENKGYSIIDTYKDSNTGYYGVLLKDNTTGKLTLSNRGTQPDKLNDLSNDTSLIVKEVPEQFDSMATFMNQLINEHKITKADDVTMTGHSLGGAETQMGVAAYSEYIDQAYTYNSPGAKDLSIPNVMEYQGEYYRNYEVLPGGIVTGEKISKALYDTYQNFKNNKDSQAIASKIINIKAEEKLCA